MDRYEEMRLFTAVVDTGSFVAAAEAMQVSKAGVSRHVAELETRLGVRLLHRTTRRLSLTDEGEVFHTRCTALLAGLAEAEDEIRSRSGEATGLLRIAVPVSYGLLRLAPLWPVFMQRHPRVTLELTLSDRMVDLVEEGYDLAVRIARLQASSLVSRRLGSTRTVLCASPGYLARHGTPEHPSQLADHTVLFYNLVSTGENWSFDGPDGPVAAKFVSRLRTNSGDTCRAAAIAGQGIILQPAFIVGEDLRSGALVELMPDYRSTTFGIHAVYPSRRHLPPKVRVMIDFLVDALHEAPWPRPAIDPDRPDVA